LGNPLGESVALNNKHIAHTMNTITHLQKPSASVENTPRPTTKLARCLRALPLLTISIFLANCAGMTPQQRELLTVGTGAVFGGIHGHQKGDAWGGAAKGGLIGYVAGKLLDSTQPDSEPARPASYRSVRRPSYAVDSEPPRNFEPRWNPVPASSGGASERAGVAASAGPQVSPSVGATGTGTISY
jgi:hypothetical protein